MQPLLAPALVVGAAYAAEPGFYLGASGGQTTVDGDAGSFGFDDNVPGFNQNYKIDGDDWGWKAYLGYQFLPWLGVEAGYVDFGGISNSYYRQQWLQPEERCRPHRLGRLLGWHIANWAG